MMKPILSKAGLVFALLGFLSAGCGGSKPPKAQTPERSLEQGDKEQGEVVPVGDKEGEEDQYVMSEDAKGIYDEALADAKAGRLDRAEQGFERVLKVDPRAHQAAYNLGVLAERKGQDADAKARYEQCINLQLDYFPAIEALANLEVRRGNLDAAVGLMRNKASSYPKNRKILAKYSDVLIFAGRYKDAIAVAKQALRIEERDVDAMLQIGKANLRLGRVELAQSVFDRVTEMDPEQAEVYYLLAQIQRDQGFDQMAIDSLKKAVEKRPTYVEAMNNLAALYLLSGNYEEAERQLAQAIEIAPSWSVLHLNYGNALRGAGRWSEAKEELNRARQLDPSQNGVLLNLGILYYVADDLDGLDRLARYHEAKKYFAQYKTERGSRLSKEDAVQKYLKEIQIAIEREERRIEAEKARKEREAEREAAREAEGEAGGDSTDTDSGEDEGWEDAGEEESGDAKDDEGGAAKDDGWY